MLNIDPEPRAPHWFTRVITHSERVERNGLPLLRFVFAEWVAEHDWHRMSSAMVNDPVGKPHYRVFLSEGSCRAVALEDVDRVLASGIDVQPTDAPLLAACLNKTVEWGGWPKFIVMLDHRQLDRSYRELPQICSDTERDAVLRHFPTEVKRRSAQSRWFSRFPASERLVGTEYERAHGYWIPRDARRAFLGLVVMEHPRLGDPLDWDRLSAKWLRGTFADGQG